MILLASLSRLRGGDTFRAMSSRPTRTSLAILCVLCAHAFGSPRSDPTAGRAVFTGAATPNPTSIDINPAALGLSVASEFYIAALGVLDRYSIDRDALDVDTGMLSSGADAITAYTASPGGTLAYVWHTGTDSRITLGFQLLKTAPAERFVENDAFRYHTLGGYHRTVSPLTIAASVRLTKRLYVGVSIAAQSNFLKLRYARDTALESGRDPDRGIDSDCSGSPCGVENPFADELYEVEVDSGLLSTAIIAANLGAVVRIAKDMWLGLGYHTPPGLAIQNELTGQVNVVRSPRDMREQITGAASVYISQPASVDMELRASLRHRLELHVGGRWEHLSRLQSYDVRGYGSTLPPNDIPEWQLRPRGFHDTFALWAGVEQVERESPLVLGGRIGVESSAIDNKRTSPLTVAPISATLDFGVQYALSDQLRVQFTYGLQYFLPVDVEDSAFDPRSRLQCFDSGFDYSTPGCANVRNGYAIPTATGEYQRIEQAIRVAVRFER